jgi:hypothetical protein
MREQENPTHKRRFGQPARHAGNRRARRRGSVFVLVLATAMVLSVLGMSAIMLGRVQRRACQSVSDVSGAKACAQAALRMGLLRIEDNPDWRFAYPHGAWESGVAIGDGTYTLQGIDPSDSDLADAPEDPVVLIGIGKKGRAVHKTRITLATVNRGYGCLQAALHAGNDLKPTNATIYCDQTLSANDDADASASDIHGDVQAADAVQGGTYHGNTEAGIAWRSMPDTVDVFDFYLANGTRIDRDDLPRGFDNVLKNPGFEAGTTGWTSPSCRVDQNTTEWHTGSASLAVTRRWYWHSGPQQDVTNIIQNGTTYEVNARIKMCSANAVGVQFRIKVHSTGSGTQYFASSHTDVRDADGWKLVSKTLTPTWSGTLVSADLRIRTRDGEIVSDYSADELVLKESGTERTIYRKLLSPTSNPFGPETNPLGIYVIDLADKKVFIKNSRIVGTLVLLTPNGGSRIGDGGPLSWEPAVAGFPAILVKNKDITINPSNAGLSEDASQVNFNPPGTPYSGLGEDLDQNDTFPSEIKGLIYGTHKIKFLGQTKLAGCVVAAGDVEIRDSFNLTHNPTYFQNPPPGFSGPEEIRILLDSAQKVVHH